MRMLIDYYMVMRRVDGGKLYYYGVSMADVAEEYLLVVRMGYSQCIIWQARLY